MNSSKFDRNYYEDGIRHGVSGYENYHWMPTRSISEAISIIKCIDFETAIDFGCAKGFMVHALRLLGKDVVGVDISEYAITNCLPQVKDKVFLLKKNMTALKLKADLVIAKDVLEHIPEKDIPKILKDFYNVCKKVLIIVPLGDEDDFRIREFEIDRTHIIRRDEEWWINQIRKSGFKLKSFDYSMGNVKEKWIKQSPYGNGFFILEK